MKPSAEFLRLADEWCGQYGTGDQPVAHIRVKIPRALAQPLQMQSSALGRADDVSRRAGACSFGNFDFG
jgi:hypothetical protein